MRPLRATLLVAAAAVAPVVPLALLGGAPSAAAGGIPTIYPSGYGNVAIGPQYSTRVTGEHFSSPAIADVGDGHGTEIIVGFSDGTVRGFTLAGAHQVWSYYTGPGAVFSSPKIVDLNGDGKLDVLVANTAGDVIAFTPALGRRTIFRQQTVDHVHGSGDFATPAVADLNRNGHLDVIETSWDEHIYAWDGRSGGVLPGFPVNLKDTSWSSPVIANLDGSGYPDIVFGFDCQGVPGQPCYPHHGGYVGVMTHNGKWVRGWPRFTPGQTVWSTPAIADLQGNGKPDIVVGTGTMPAAAQMGGGQEVYAFQANGSYVPGWPVRVAGRVMSSPAVGSVTGSGLQVAVVDDTGRLYLINHDGHVLWSHCVANNSANCPNAHLHASPVIADINGDGHQDVVVGGEQWLWAFDRNGATMAGLTLGMSATHTNPTTAAPAITSVGGQTTIVAASEETVLPGWHYGRVFVWQPSGYRLGSASWPEFERDAYRDGNLGALPAPGAAASGTTGLAIYQTTPVNQSVVSRAHAGSAWSPPNNLGGTVIDGPAATTTSSGSHVVAVTAPDGTVWVGSQGSGGFQGWHGIGGRTEASPAIGAVGTSWNVAVTGTDNAAWLYSAGRWYRLGGTLRGQPAVAQLPDGTLMVMVTGSDGTLWYRRHGGSGWSNWSRLGGASAFGPGMVATAAGVAVYATGTNGNVYEQDFAGGRWTGWADLGGEAVSSPAAYAANGNRGVVVYGTDGNLYQRPAGSGWLAVP